ncbi:hypothetical protein HDU97_009942 [Phlyctochytrium planicorne]|nr:hypothetical protein HDU97_009942 [Phlyctochytrium planicorne]
MQEVNPPAPPPKSPHLYQDSVMPAEPNPDEMERLQLEQTQQQYYQQYQQGDYGNEMDKIGSEFEYYSNPNSRPQSSQPQHQYEEFKVSEEQGTSGPLKSRDNYLANGAYPESSLYERETTGGLKRAETDREMAERIAREQLAIIANEPNGVTEREMPPALVDPEARKQMPELKSHKPWFLGTMTLIQITTVIVSFILNQQGTGSLIQTNPFNVMIGPTPGVLIQMGARFLPCIRNTTLNTGSNPIILCPDGIKSSTTALNPATNELAASCTLEQICGFGGFHGEEPKQWYRFIIPIFLHGGLVHLIVNLLFQVQTGFQLEKDFGWWRIAAIYFIAGIGGFIFGGNFNGLTPSVGCSGALFGLMACLLIDLFQNWRVIQNPWWELAKLIFTILLSFLIGMLPYIDNFAHIGGFFCGLLAGLIFMPTVHYSKWDGRIKTTLMVISIPVLITIYILLIRGFYTGQNDCPWCKYLNCIPGMPWCESKWNQNITTNGT